MKYCYIFSKLLKLPIKRFTTDKDDFNAGFSVFSRCDSSAWPAVATSSSSANSSSQVTMVKTFQAYLPQCHRTYSCIHCRAHLANHDELISKVGVHFFFSVTKDFTYNLALNCHEFIFRGYCNIDKIMRTYYFMFLYHDSNKLFFPFFFFN